MARTFTETFKVWLPSWLGGAGSEPAEGEEGTDDEKVVASLSLLLDDYIARAKWGLLARFPGLAVYLDDEAALAAIGRDRRIVRGINEPAASYGERLTRAIDDHRTRGNPYAMLEQLQAYLQAPCVVRTVDPQGNWFTIDADGNRSCVLTTNEWDWDGAPSTEWSRFWVVIYPVGGTDPWAVSGELGDSATYGDGEIDHPNLAIGLTATVDQVNSVRAIIREWKPANAACEWVIVAFDEATFGPFISPSPMGLWGNWSNGAGSPARLDTARYWKGVSAS